MGKARRLGLLSYILNALAPVVTELILYKVYLCFIII
jgi:hypothetical protein